jgi:hypothetical protein
MPKRDVPPALERWLSHPIQEGVRFDEKGCKFQALDIDGKWKTVSGLLPKLKKVFWNDYVYVPAKYGKGTGAGSKWGGRARGTLVHSEVEKYVTLSPEAFRRAVPEPHPYTAKVILAMRQYKLTPVGSEVVVYDPDTRVAHMVDLVCADAKGNIYTFEMKIGGDGYFRRGNAPLGAPFDSYVNSPANQAHLQQMFPRYILEEKYGVRLAGSHVLQVCKKGVTPHNLPKKMWLKRHSFYARFAEGLDSIRKRKK